MENPVALLLLYLTCTIIAMILPVKFQTVNIAVFFVGGSLTLPSVYGSFFTIMM